MNLKEFKIEFDKIFADMLKKNVDEVRSVFEYKRLEEFVDYIKDYCLSWWKRIRPYMAYLTYVSFWWKNIDEILRFSVIFETFHNMALIHDDIIDKSTKRHNVFTINEFIKENIWHEHISNSQAMLIWDLMLNRVYSILNEKYDFDMNLLEQARDNVFLTIQNTIIWEMIDVDMMLLDRIHTIENINKKNLLKTAVYTFSRPMLIGSILWGASKKEQDDVFELWKNLWLAFQVRDDLMDIIHWDNTKSWFSDVQEWQQTLFTNYIMTKWTDRQKKILKKYLWKKLNNSQIKKMQEVFLDSWAIEFWKKTIDDFLVISDKILKWMTFDDNYKIFFLQIINKIKSQ